MAAGDSKTGPSKRVATVVAVLALAVYLVGLAWLSTKVDAAEPAWSRFVLLLTGVEAVAFAAAGWLWGVQVSRGALEAVQGQLQKKDEELGNARDEVAAKQDEVVREARQAAELDERVRAAVLAGDAFSQRAGDDGDPDRASGSTQGRSRSLPGGSTEGEALRQFLRSLHPKAFEQD